MCARSEDIADKENLRKPGLPEIKPPCRSATTATPQTSDKKKIALLTRKLNDALSQQTAASPQTRN
jgi:hypothetical protein